MIRTQVNRILLIFMFLCVQACWADSSEYEETEQYEQKTTLDSEKSCEGCEYYTFQVVTGKEEQVCNAYKTKLESIPFLKPPYCDHMDKINGKGFDPLVTEKLEFEEVRKIYDKVQSFYLNSDQDFSKKRGKPYGYQDEPKERKYYKTQHIEALRFSVLVDITNDGEADKIIIWKKWRCSDIPEERMGYLQAAYIMDEHYSNIDEEKTLSVFGHPNQFELINRFRFIGPSINIFKYKDVAYFSTWPLGYFYDEDKRDNVDIQVYMHQGDKTTLVCELNWKERL